MSSSAVELTDARAQQVAVTDDSLSIDLVDGRTIIVPLGWYPRLWHATLAERAHFELLDDGRYIHWPDVDEDLTVAGLLAGHPSCESPESLRQWLDLRQVGRK